MTDNCSGFTRDQFLGALKDYGPDLSIHEIAALCRVSIAQALCVAHHHPWEILPVTGDYSGWKYRRRPVLDAKGRMAKEVGVFNDSGLSHSGKRAVLRKGSVQ